MAEQGSEAPARVVVIGTAAAGKSTLAHVLSEAFAVPHIDLDEMRWDARGRPRPDLRGRVEAATQADRWVADGYLHDLEDLTVARAELVVWLDLPLRVSAWRLARRTLVRRLFRMRPWAAERSHLQRMGPLLWHALVARRSRRYGWAGLSERHPHLDVVRLRTVGEVMAWVDGVARG